MNNETIAKKAKRREIIEGSTSFHCAGRICFAEAK
jgi:hypothetical protein